MSGTYVFINANGVDAGRGSDGSGGSGESGGNNVVKEGNRGNAGSDTGNECTTEGSTSTGHGRRRPAGRAPKGKVWDTVSGTYVFTEGAFIKGTRKFGDGGDGDGGTSSGAASSRNRSSSMASLDGMKGVAGEGCAGGTAGGRGGREGARGGGGKGRPRGRVGGRKSSKGRSQTFELHVPTADTARRVRQMASVASALQLKHMEYHHELVYARGCMITSNNALLEASVVGANREEQLGGAGALTDVSRRRCEVKKVTQLNRQIIQQYKDMCRAGEMPPLRVILDPVQGFVVVSAVVCGRESVCACPVCVWACVCGESTAVDVNGV